MKKISYLSTSEHVSTGHPDRLADLIAAKIIDDVNHNDKENGHAAIEVFLAHDEIIIGGEATTTIKIDSEYLKKVCSQAFFDAGYIVRKYWNNDGKTDYFTFEDVENGTVKIKNKIAAQSPDIAAGTTTKAKESGWNDQGIYFSSAEKNNKEQIGVPMYYATKIGNFIFNQSLTFDSVYGSDIKVLVTMKTDKSGIAKDVSDITAITVAVPTILTHEECEMPITTMISKACGVDNIYDICPDVKIVINGTGVYRLHGMLADTSMTGRKISVNHPSAGPVWCNKMIGGGSLVKPWHASDLLLNIYSRFIALTVVNYWGVKYAVVGCSGGIGQKDLQSIFVKTNQSDRYNAEISEWVTKNYSKVTPYSIATLFNMFDDDFSFYEAVKNNFFGNAKTQPWECADY